MWVIIGLDHILSLVILPHILQDEVVQVVQRDPVVCDVPIFHQNLFRTHQSLRAGLKEDLRAPCQGSEDFYILPKEGYPGYVFSCHREAKGGAEQMRKYVSH